MADKKQSSARDQRLAKALRNNLRRRKAAGRKDGEHTRGASPSSGPDKSS